VNLSKYYECFGETLKSNFNIVEKQYGVHRMLTVILQSPA
jgi:hypothetical protein